MNMKHLRETFTDEEFKRLKEAKGTLNWHDFLMAYATKIYYCTECHKPIPQLNSALEQIKPLWIVNLPFCSSDCCGNYLHK